MELTEIKVINLDQNEFYAGCRNAFYCSYIGHLNMYGRRLCFEVSLK